MRFFKKKSEQNADGISSDFAHEIMDFAKKYPDYMTTICESWFDSDAYKKYCDERNIKPSEVKTNDLQYSVTYPTVKFNADKTIWVAAQDYYFIITNKVIVFSYPLIKHFVEIVNYAKRIAMADCVKTLTASRMDMFDTPININDDTLRKMYPQFPYWCQSEDNIKIQIGFDTLNKIPMISLTTDFSNAESFQITPFNGLYCIHDNEYDKFKRCLQYTKCLDEGKYVVQECDVMGMFIAQKSYKEASSPIFYV